MQRKTYSARALIGHPYGSVFEIQNKKVVLAGGPLAGGLDLDDLNTAEAGEEGAEPAGDTDIASLKASGASGKDILSAMVGNCASFAGKTRFSQVRVL